MMPLLERVFARYEFEEVRSAWIARARREHGRIDPCVLLHDRGYERVDVAVGVLMTDDGREVLRLDGQPWSLRPEVHAARVREAMDAATARAGVPKAETAAAAEPVTEAMEQARKRDAAERQSQPAQPPTTCTSLIAGQLCGGTLIRATVCPRCALGKSGVTATLTCDVCGHVTAIMRGDK